MEEKPRRVQWRNILLLVALGSPLAYYASNFIEPPLDAPRVTSPEGRRIFRDFMRRNLPAFFAGKGASR